MIGNISKVSRKGSKGEKGDTPKVIFTLDADGNLWCDSDGIFVDKEYADSRDFASKGFVGEFVGDKENLHTESKADVVTAINEIVDQKVRHIYIDDETNEDTENYPTTYAVASAIIENGLHIEQSAFEHAEEYTNDKVAPIEQQTEKIKVDIQGLQKHINEESHFRGYLKTNDEIKGLKKTPNDFAYSAQSGTVWICNENLVWQDSGNPVPDQLTPASTLTPSMNGEASTGSENAYARGDHIHPIDITRASVEELDLVRSIAEDAHGEAYNVANDVYAEDGEVAKKIQNKTAWELVKSDTLTSTVTLITNTFEHRYKELYVLMHIETMKSEEVTTVSQGKVTLWAGKRYNNQIFSESNTVLGDGGEPLALAFHIELLGKYFRVHRYYKSNTTNTFYTSSAIASSGYADIGQTYIDMLTIDFYNSAERQFPAGTYYEIWGVRA